MSLKKSNGCSFNIYFQNGYDLLNIMYTRGKKRRK